MTLEQIKKASLYKLANRLYILGGMVQNDTIQDEFEMIDEEMWKRKEKNCKKKVKKIQSNKLKGGNGNE